MLNLAHALDHHPFRDHKVWGVRVTHPSSVPNGTPHHTYAARPGSYCFGRIPNPALNLKDAFECYIDAISTWNNVHIYRVQDMGNGSIITIDDESALRAPTYAPPPLTATYERLRLKGAKFPSIVHPASDLHHPSAVTAPDASGTAIYG